MCQYPGFLVKQPFVRISSKERPRMSCLIYDLDISEWLTLRNVTLMEDVSDVSCDLVLELEFCGSSWAIIVNIERAMTIIVAVREES